jgi:hypothetical protein
MVADLTLHRRAFWGFLAEAAPTLHARTVRGNETTRWLPVGPMPLVAAHYISAGAVGIFVRGARGTRIGHIREFLFPYREFLAGALGQPDLRMGSQFLIHSGLRLDMSDRDNWPRAAEWLEVNSAIYEAALTRLQRLP